jgi:hypothetical protein
MSTADVGGPKSDDVARSPLTHLILRVGDDAVPPDDHWVLRAAAVGMSGLVHDILEEDCGAAAAAAPHPWSAVTPDTYAVIPVPADLFSARTVRAVVRYVEYRFARPPDPIECPLWGPLSDVIDEWDADFLSVGGGEPAAGEWWADCLLAANFLGVRPLTSLLGAALAARAGGRTALQTLAGDIPHTVLRECVEAYVHDGGWESSIPVTFRTLVALQLDLSAGVHPADEWIPLLQRGIRGGRNPLRTVDLDLSGGGAAVEASASVLASALSDPDHLPDLRRLRLRLDRCGLSERSVTALLFIRGRMARLHRFELSLWHNACEAVYVRAHSRDPNDRRDPASPAVEWPVLSPGVRTVVGRATVITAAARTWYAATVAVPQRMQHSHRYLLAALFGPSVPIVRSKVVVAPAPAVTETVPPYPDKWPEAGAHDGAGATEDGRSMYVSRCLYVPAADVVPESPGWRLHALHMLSFHRNMP